MQSDVVALRVLYFTVVFERYLLPKNTEERLLVGGHKRPVDGLPQRLFSLENVFETWVLILLHLALRTVLARGRVGIQPAYAK